MPHAIALPFATLSRVSLRAHAVAAVSACVSFIGLLGVVAVVGDPMAAQTFARAALPVEAPEPDAPVTLAAAGEAAIAHAGDAAGLRPAGDESLAPRLPGIVDLDAAEPAEGAATLAAARGPEPKGAGLAPAPIAGLTRTGPGGPLPAVGPGGERPAEAYARPFAQQGSDPRVAVILGGLGLSERVTTAAVEELPPEITLSFVPYADDLQSWIDRARAKGHEVLIEIPMEPFDYPANDPGPHTLLSDAGADENLRRLDWLMARATGYFGVMNYLGAKFTASEAALGPVVAALKARGVAVVYDGESHRSALKSVAAREGLDYAAADRILDAKPSAAAIDEQLLHLEALAIQNGSALGAAFAYPVSITQLKEWADTLAFKGYQLAPASAVVFERTAARDRETRASRAEAPTGAPAFVSMSASYGPRATAGAANGDDKGGHGGGSDH